jgi:hypothetical protein
MFLIYYAQRLISISQNKCLLRSHEKWPPSIRGTPQQEGFLNAQVLYILYFYHINLPRGTFVIGSLDE